MRSVETAYKMQIEWNELCEEWFQRASDYTGFHKELSRILTTCFSSHEELCDLGCGSGLIDMQMASQFEKLTCIDRSMHAIDLLNEKIRSQRKLNIRSICQDLFKIEESWENVMMLFTGVEFGNLPQLLGYCREKLIIVNRGGCINNAAVTGKVHKYHSMLPMINYLKSIQAEFEMQEYELEYGQPFQSMGEAYRYILHYHKCPVKQSISEYMEENIVRTGEKEYPFYLPYKKKFAVFEFEKEKNLHVIE